MIKAIQKKIGEHCEIDPDVDIKAGSLEIGDYVKIMKGFKARVSNQLYIDNCSLIYPDVSITGRNISLGQYSCFRENVVIGGGQSTNIKSEVSIGKGCLICENVLINNANYVTIGDEVGIGKEVDVWTHTGFPNILDGYPNYTSQVRIGHHSWIASRSTILAGIFIGNYVVVGNHSLVNRSLPDGCFAGGVPCKIIAHTLYPMNLSANDKFEIINRIVNEYKEIMRWKGFWREIYHKNIEGRIIFFAPNINFNLNTMTVSGKLDEYAEDFRDHLRRHGIKFYTGKPFKSITPEPFRKLDELK